MIGIACLDKHFAGLFSAACAACGLRNLLESSFRGPQVATFKAKVGIDDPDKGQLGKVIAFGDQLRADDDIDGFAFDPCDKFRCLFRRP